MEALERAYPLRVLRYRLRRGSGGAGLAPGGEGIERDLQVLEDCTVSLITERRVSAPWGLAGGAPGAVGENWLLPGGDEGRAERLPDKCAVRLRAGDVVRMLTPGGGGWGMAPKPFATVVAGARASMLSAEVRLGADGSAIWVTSRALGRGAAGEAVWGRRRRGPG